MQNISGFGLVARIVASVTFPNGFDVTAFADDSDPLDSANIALADSGMGLNGDLVVWSKAQVIDVTLNVIANTDDDDNLAVLFESNRLAKAKTSARDVVGMTLIYPDGKLAQLSPGFLISGTALPSIATAGRYKTRPYNFRFQNITKSNG